MLKTLLNSTYSLNKHLLFLLQEPDVDVEIEKLVDCTVATFDTVSSNFDLILDDNRGTALLMEYSFVASPDGEIEDYDVNFKASHEIATIEQFLNIIQQEQQ